MPTFVQDLRLAFRVHLRSPGLTTIAVLTLALGIGANTTIFSAVNGILIAPLPYAGSERLVRIEIVRHHANADSILGLSLSTIEDVRTGCPAFEDMATFTAYSASRIQTDVGPDVVSSSSVSGEFFSVLAVRPLIGRVILPSDIQVGYLPVAVLSYSLWKDGFGSDPRILERRILVGNEWYTVVGVMPRDFAIGTSRARGLWMPFMPQGKDDQDKRTAFVVAKVKKGLSLSEANAQLDVLTMRLAKALPSQPDKWKLVARGVKEELIKNVRPGLFLLWGTVGFVLLIACVNVGGLLLARGWTRQREIAIREALGATHLRIVRQFLAEGLLLGVAGGMAGLLVSVWGIRILRLIAPPNTPRIDQLKLDADALGFTLAVSLLAGFLFALAPAVQVTGRPAGITLKERLSILPLSCSARPRQRLRATLVVMEVALAFILAVGAGLLVRSFQKLLTVDLGYRTDQVLTLSVLLSRTVCDPRKPELCQTALTEILERVRSLSGVASAGATSIRPLGGKMATKALYVEALMDEQDVAQGSVIQYRSVSAGYFPAMGIPVLSGRSFLEADSAASESVAIVNRSFSLKYLSAKPIGKHIAMFKSPKGKPLWMRVVGEVGDTRDVELEKRAEPQFYVPTTQAGYFGGNLVIRTTGDPLTLANSIRQQIWAVDKDAPIMNLKTMEQAFAEKVAQPKFQTFLLSGFAALAIGLAIVGVYGLISFSVSQRASEIGVRMALGARPWDTVLMVVGEGVRLSTWGVGLGILGALVLTRFLSSLLFEMRPNDSLTFTFVSILFLLVVLVACYFPARRATRVDPAIALRDE